MTNLSTVSVNGTPPGDLLVESAGVPTLIVNTDLTNSLYLGRQNNVLTGDTRQSITLSPQSFVVFNGDEEVYGLTQPGVTIQVQVIPGGVSYFQSGISSGSLVVNKSGLFLYNGQPALGTLMFSIAATAGVDPFGNAYLANEDVGQFAPLVHIYSIPGSSGVIDFPTQYSAAGILEKIVSEIAGSVVENAPGAHHFLQMLARGPSINLSGHDDYVFLEFNSANEDATSFANMEFIYQDPTTAGGIGHEYCFMDGSGFHVTAGSINSVDPNSGLTPANPARGEIWHPLGGLGLANSFTQISGQMNSAYRLLPDGNVQIEVGLTRAAFTATTGVTTNPLGASYRPNSRIFLPGALPGDASLDINTSGVLNAILGSLASATNLRASGTFPTNN